MKIDSELLKKQREAISKSQEEMAIQLDIGYRTYQEIEKNGEVKKADDYVKICAFLGQKIVPDKVEVKYFTKDELMEILKLVNPKGISEEQIIELIKKIVSESIDKIVKELKNERTKKEIVHQQHR